MHETSALILLNHVSVSEELILSKCHPLNTKSNTEISSALFYYSFHIIYEALTLNNVWNPAAKIQQLYDHPVHAVSSVYLVRKI